MTIAVLGANGQLGRELGRAGAEQGIELLSLPRAALDISDGEAVARALERPGISAVINAAAYTAVDKAESEAERAWAVNEKGPDAIARACAARGVPLFHVSTDYVFDGQKSGAYVESDAVAPMGVYGASKEAGERAVRALWPKHVILRTSWVFSAFGHNFVKTMLRLAAERPELRVVGDQRGRPTATRDLALALLSLARRHLDGQELAWGTYHFAGAEATSWHGFAVAIVELAAAFTGKRPNVVEIRSEDYPTPARRPANSVLDTGLFERTFGLAPRPWRAGLREVIEELCAPPAAQGQI